MPRTKADGLYYNGCGDSCLYPSIIADACNMTRKVNLSSSNIICDASKIWFWAERYPFPCLEAVGEIYKADALWWKRVWLSGLYIFVPVFVGVIFLVVLFVTEWLRSSWKSRPYIAGQRGDVGIKAPLLSRAALVVLVLTVLLNPATAYPCPNLYPPYNRLFTSADGTRYSVIYLGHHTALTRLILVENIALRLQPMES